MSCPSQQIYGFGPGVFMIWCLFSPNCLHPPTSVKGPQNSTDTAANPSNPSVE
ncbi:hypothetical protein MGG_15308 [Pyricularia oryzae 70-15]|uniref:Uncharacterized protein n=1 Tax=Pyricularia oryzae (strain 70-15 / ATCC MYA-4617 / FGSC 8958) TaxID=242507 RepID=G4MR99_PYRO7|nr:uncharacterized protein MGG_15308 [Pyricularia oryzae 70-15]EHA58224.1 hypothetical protein MGG_15308 [Pyricularia oryzae 70-15]